MPENKTICPRCGSDSVYIVLGAKVEEYISCGKCGFMGEAKE